MSMKVTYNQNWAKFKKAAFLDEGLLEIATDVDKRAKALAPKATRALVNSGRIDPVSGGYSVKFGSSRVPYARRRHLENKKSPQTIGYLANAGYEILRGNISKYFKGKI